MIITVLNCRWWSFCSKKWR